MRLIQFQMPAEKRRVGLIEDDKVFDLTGYTPEEITGMHNLRDELVYADDIPMLEELAKNAKQPELKEISDLEFRVNKKDGSIIWVSIATIIHERDNNQVPLQQY